MFYAFIMLWLISHAYCVLCVVPWVGGMDVYTMWAVHCLSALVSWARLCMSIMIMLDACMTTDSYIRAVICRCTAYIFLYFFFDYVFISIA